MLNQQKQKKNHKNPLSLALKKLTYRAYSQKELALFLSKFDFDQQQIDEVMSQLLSWGYLDDQKLALNYLNYYTEQKPHGCLYISKKLAEKGISKEIISSVLDNYDRNKELELARSLAEKFINNKTRQKSVEQLKSMVARHLYNKGFSKTSIITVLNEKFFLDN